MFDGFFFLSDAPMAISSTIARYSGNTGPFNWLIDSLWWKLMLPIAHISNFAAQIYLMMTWGKKEKTEDWNSTGEEKACADTWREDEKYNPAEKLLESTCDTEFENYADA